MLPFVYEKGENKNILFLFAYFWIKYWKDTPTTNTENKAVWNEEWMGRGVGENFFQYIYFLISGFNYVNVLSYVFLINFEVSLNN